MSEPLDESYLNWLYSQVAQTRTRNPSGTYWNLLRMMYKTEFVWLVPNDDNRIEDGRDLRMEFLRERHIHDADPDWHQMPCSFLELLVGLSRRLSFEGGNTPDWWFWKMVQNIHLFRYTDAHPLPTEDVQRRLDAVVWRTYDSNGLGGLFPLDNPSQDQTEVELWYQLNAYLLENGYV